MIAALPMYDAGPARAANDALWARWSEALRARGLAAPESLDRSRPPEAIWRDPNLLVAQGCALPWVIDLQGLTRIVGTPRYAAPGCAGACYRSALVVRRARGIATLRDCEGGTVAINALRSHSGRTAMAMALEDCGAGLPHFARARITGSHRASLAAVAAGDADIAAIDCVTLAHARAAGVRALASLRVIGETPSAPALPFLTARVRGPDAAAVIRAALEDALARPEARAARETLFLEGIGTVEESQYEPIRRACAGFRASAWQRTRASAPARR